MLKNMGKKNPKHAQLIISNNKKKETKKDKKPQPCYNMLITRAIKMKDTRVANWMKETDW